jgi:transcriptional regulator of acetoin/glycerol metabolism
MNNEQFEQDVEHLRSLQQRLGRIIDALEELPIFRAQEPATGMPDGVIPLAAMERVALLRAVKACDGDVVLAAKALGIGKTTLYRRLQKYGVAVRGRCGGE